MTQNSPEMLFNMTPNRSKSTQNYDAAMKTIAALKQDDAIAASDAALVELVLSTARDVDAISDDDAASGRSTLRKTYLLILETLERRAAMNSGRSLSPADNVLAVIQGQAS